MLTIADDFRFCDKGKPTGSAGGAACRPQQAAGSSSAGGAACTPQQGAALHDEFSGSSEESCSEDDESSEEESSEEEDEEEQDPVRGQGGMGGSPWVDCMALRATPRHVCKVCHKPACSLPAIPRYLA